MGEMEKETPMQGFRCRNRRQEVSGTFEGTDAFSNSKPPSVGSYGVLLSIVFLIFSITAEAAEGKKLRVVTTILPEYCFVSGVVGDLGDVQNLLPPNIGPHDYQLTPSDYRKIRDADLIVFNGAGLDNWISKAFKGAENSRTLELGAALKTDLIPSAPDVEIEGDHKHAHEHQHGADNPHFWQDPLLAIRCVTNILATVQKIDPAHAADYAKNADAYIARLKQLDAEVAAKVAPVREKPFVTQHDAFPYLVRRYQLHPVGVLEVTPDVPPSPRYLADLAKVIREKQVRVIFADPQSSKRLVNQVAADAKIRVANLGTLESGKISPDAYEKGMRENAETLARELKD